MKRVMAPVIIMALLSTLLLAFDESDPKKRVKEIKAWLPTREYTRAYTSESDEVLEKVVLFVEEPLKHLSLVRGLNREALWRDIWLYDTFRYETKRTTEGFRFSGQLCSLTATMSEDKVSLMTFLMLNCLPGAYAELIEDLYCRLLNSNTHMFIEYLGSGKNWKQVVDRMGTCSARDTEEMISKLGDSEFEREFKEYVLTKYPFIRKSKEKKDVQI